MITKDNFVHTKIAYPVVQALLARINSLRNNNLEQAITECQNFINALEAMNVAVLPALSSTAIYATIGTSTPITSTIGLGAGMVLAKTKPFDSMYPKSPLVLRMVPAASFTVMWSNMIYTLGIGALAMATYLYSMAQNESSEPDTYYSNAFYEQLVNTLHGTVAVQATNVGAASIVIIIHEAKALLLVLKIEKNGIASIKNEIVNFTWKNESHIKLADLYRALKEYGNENTTDVLMYLHQLSDKFDVFEEMLPNLKNTNRRLFNDHLDSTIEVRAAARRNWSLVEKLLKINKAADPVLPNLTCPLLQYAISQNNYDAADMILRNSLENKTESKIMGAQNTVETLILKEIARRQSGVEVEHIPGFPSDVMQYIREFAASKLESYFGMADTARANVYKVLNNKNNPNYQAYNTALQKHIDQIYTDQAKIVFVKIINAMGIPKPGDGEHGDYYEIFQNKFQPAFNKVLSNKGMGFIIESKQSIYEIAECKKKEKITLDNINFEELLPTVSKPNLKA